MEHDLSHQGAKIPYEMNEKASSDNTRRRSSAVNPEVIAGEIYDENYGGTQRGLKSRHAQMIALGGKTMPLAPATATATAKERLD